MMSFTIRSSLAATAVGAMLALGACDTGPSASEQTVGFAMEASHDEIVAGETVTLRTSAMNTLGREAEVKWHAQGAPIRTSENGRVAQVTFDRPGVYTVSADLMVDGVRMQTQSETIEVRPLTIPGGGQGPEALKSRSE